MSILAPASPQALNAGATAQPRFGWILCGAFVLVAAQLLAQHWTATASTLPDADDAMRLVQMRAYLDGPGWLAGWFDLHEPRLNPPGGYDTHWSRLIDAGLAAFYMAFRIVAEPDFAERLTVAVWPVLWLFPVLGGTAAIAWRLGEGRGPAAEAGAEGRAAALAALLLALFAIPGFQQFRPGRIDHHNIHIALAVLAVAAAVWSDRKGWCAAAAGGLAGISLAIGFEALIVHMVVGAAIVLRFVRDPLAADETRAYAAALAAATAFAFGVTVPPQHFGRAVCDQLAINSGAAVLTGAALLFLAAQFYVHRGARVRFAAVMFAACATIAVLLLIEPACIGGPYAMIDPAIRPIWLSEVSEAQPLSRMFRESLQTGVAMAAFPLVALLATLGLGFDPARRRSFAFLVAAAVFLVIAAMAVDAIRAYSYAVWFGIPPVAVALLAMTRRLRWSGAVPRFLLALLLTPAAVTLAAMAAAEALGAPPPLDLNGPDRQACTDRARYAPLNTLPPGLVVVSDLEWAPYLLAYTYQSVAGAPYHRVPAGIVLTHGAFAAPPDEARAMLRQADVTYLAVCGHHGPDGMDVPQWSKSVWRMVEEDRAPAWLEKLPQSDPGAFRLYRVR